VRCQDEKSSGTQIVAQMFRSDMCFNCASNLGANGISSRGRPLPCGDDSYDDAEVFLAAWTLNHSRILLLNSSGAALYDPV